jgi:hypothetical protein
MGIKNIYERFIWFDDQVKLKKYPNATSLPKRLEVSLKTAQRDVKFMRKRLTGILETSLEIYGWGVIAMIVIWFLLGP